MQISFAGGITANDPLTTHEISNLIEKDLLESFIPPLWEELLINAKQYLYETEYRHSILESVIALELVVSDYIRSKFRESGTLDRQADALIKDIGLTGNLKVLLPFMTHNQEKPSNALLSRCTGSITVRNSIVHKGLGNVSSKQAEDALDSCTALISFIKSL